MKPRRELDGPDHLVALRVELDDPALVALADPDVSPDRDDGVRDRVEGKTSRSLISFRSRFDLDDLKLSQEVDGVAAEGDVSDLLPCATPASVRPDSGSTRSSS